MNTANKCIVMPVQPYFLDLSCHRPFIAVIQACCLFDIGTPASPGDAMSVCNASECFLKTFISIFLEQCGSSHRSLALSHRQSRYLILVPQ